MKILVTGGSGFIGSHLCERLVFDGNFVTAVDNLSRGLKKNIKHLFNNSFFKFIEIDICNKKDFFDIVSQEKYDVIFHLAANSDIQSSIKNPDIDFKNTFLTTYNTVLAMKEFNIKNIVFASSSAIYGEIEDDIKEDIGPLFPISHYGASKLASEAFISSFCENYNLKAWIIRFPNVIGERATHGVIYDFINKLKKNPVELEVLGDGNQTKPYIYIKDLINAILFIYKNSNEKINYYNVGVKSRISVKEIAEIVIREMGLNAKIKYTGGKKGWIGDVAKFNYNTEKIIKLGFEPKFSSQEAVKKTVKEILDWENLCN